MCNFDNLKKSHITSLPLFNIFTGDPVFMLTHLTKIYMYITYQTVITWISI
jgi:hypothetical protein